MAASARRTGVASRRSLERRVEPCRTMPRSPRASARMPGSFRPRTAGGRASMRHAPHPAARSTRRAHRIASRTDIRGSDGPAGSLRYQRRPRSAGRSVARARGRHSPRPHDLVPGRYRCAVRCPRPTGGSGDLAGLHRAPGGDGPVPSSAHACIDGGTAHEARESSNGGERRSHLRSASRGAGAWGPRAAGGRRALPRGWAGGGWPGSPSGGVGPDWRGPSRAETPTDSVGGRDAVGADRLPALGLRRHAAPDRPRRTARCGGRGRDALR